MKNKIQIPAGWYRLRKGVFIKKGDKYLGTNGFTNSNNYDMHQWRAGMNSFVYIRQKLIK